jgi:hypothetical protein
MSDDQAGDGAMQAVHELKATMMDLAMKMTTLQRQHRIRIEFGITTDPSTMTVTLSAFKALQELKTDQ